ncbi:Cdc6/Cdc18 family protein [Halosegnis rubeus]|uniref:ORC1-type DNA replication protein n=1 Tax=Halosegnis rubeus TaxID=2212850 RepID=A0A5N5UKW7_9EURY|nr:AAA family ATPase [Halosegnis rubeus]KAB7519461.1 AAA family ATPase [Halosegnis rubeus]
MTDYDDLFAETAPDGSVFADKQALDPLQPPDTIRGRDEHQRQLASILNGVSEGYLPPTVTIHGPPGTGKTVTTRRVCQEFAARHDSVAVEYVNLKECRSIFSAAREIHLELTGETVEAYEGVDGAFTGIWEALADYPAWTVLILDEIDQIKQDANYDPSDFLYRLLRGEGKLKRDIQLSAWLISNELVEVDLRLDSRVESAMSDEAVFFGPYGTSELDAIVGPQLDAAFRDETLPVGVREYGIQEAARRWGDARKTLRLFRRAGEAATEQGGVVTRDYIDANFDATDAEATKEKLLSLPFNHFIVLLGITSRYNPQTDEIIQPVLTTQVGETLRNDELAVECHLSDRTIRDLVTDLETMGLVETWIESRGRGGRAKQVETVFNPTWVQTLHEQYFAE